MKLSAQRSERREMHDRAEDWANLTALIESGSLEAEELDRFVDIKADLEARTILDPEACLTSKQRSWVADRVRTLGLREPTFESGMIPRGKHVDHLEGVPASYRKPLKPPGRK